MGNTVNVNINATDNGSIDKVTKSAKVLNKELKEAQTTANNMSKAAPASAALSKAKSPITSAAVAKSQDIEEQYRQTRALRGTGAEGRDFAKQAQGIGGLVHVYATFAANIFAVTAAFTALSKAMDIERMTQATNILAVNSGRDLKGLAKNLREVSDYAMSTAESIQAVNFGTSAGLGSKQLQDLTKVAKGASIALGRDFSDSLSRVTRGAIKLEPELLDELGIITKASEAYKSYGDAIGVSADNLTKFQKTQAFTNAVISEGLDKYGDLVNMDASPFNKFLASLKDAATTLANFANKVIAPILDRLSGSQSSMMGLLVGISVYLLNKAIPALTEWGSAAKKSAEAGRIATKGLYEALQADHQKSIAIRKAAAIEEANVLIATNQDAIAKMAKNMQTGFATSNKKVKALLADVSPVEGITAATATSLQKSVATGIAYNTRVLASDVTDDKKLAAQTRLNALLKIEAGLKEQINVINANSADVVKKLDAIESMGIATTEKWKLSWTGVKLKVQEAKIATMQFIADMAVADKKASNIGVEGKPRYTESSKAARGKIIEGAIAGGVGAGVALGTEHIIEGADKVPPKLEKLEGGFKGVAEALGTFMRGALSFLSWASLAYIALDLLFPQLFNGAKAFQELKEKSEGFKESADNISGTMIKLGSLMTSSMINPAKQAQKAYEIMGNAVDQMSTKFEEMSIALNKGLSESDGIWGKLTGAKDKVIKDTKDTAIQILSEMKKIKGSTITDKDIIDITMANPRELSQVLQEISGRSTIAAEQLKALSSRIGEIRDGWGEANKKLKEYSKKEDELKSEFQPFHENMKKFVDMLAGMSTENKIKQVVGLDAETKEHIQKYYPEVYKILSDIMKLDYAQATVASNRFWESNTTSVIALKGALNTVNSEFDTYMRKFREARALGQSGLNEAEKLGANIATQTEAIKIAKERGKSDPQAIIEAEKRLEAAKQAAKALEEEANLARKLAPKEDNSSWFGFGGGLRGSSAKQDEQLLKKKLEDTKPIPEQVGILAAKIELASTKKTDALEQDKPKTAEEVRLQAELDKQNAILKAGGGKPKEGIKEGPKGPANTSEFTIDKSKLRVEEMSLKLQEAKLRDLQSELDFRGKIGDTSSDQLKTMQDEELVQRLAVINQKEKVDKTKLEFDNKKAIASIEKNEAISAAEKKEQLEDQNHLYKIQMLDIEQKTKEEAKSVEYAKKYLEYTRLVDPLLEKEISSLTTLNSLLAAQFQYADQYANTGKEKLDILNAQKALLEQQLGVELKLLDQKIEQAKFKDEEIQSAETALEVQNLEYQKQLKINQAKITSVDIAKKELEVRMRSSKIFDFGDAAEDFGNKINEYAKTMKSAAEVFNEAIVKGLDTAIDDLYEAIDKGTLTLKGVMNYTRKFIETTFLEMQKNELKKFMSETLSNIFPGTKAKDSPEVAASKDLTTKTVALTDSVDALNTTIQNSGIGGIKKAFDSSTTDTKGFGVFGTGNAGNEYAKSQGFEPLDHTTANAGFYDEQVKSVATAAKEIGDSVPKLIDERSTSQQIFDTAVKAFSSSTGIFGGLISKFGSLIMQMLSSMMGGKGGDLLGGIGSMFSGSKGGGGFWDSVGGWFSGGSGAIASSGTEGFLGMLGSVAAKGGVYPGVPGLSQYSNSVVDSPIMFAYAKGGIPTMGLAGEAGPEAIMPLKRGPDGNLGIRAHGPINNSNDNSRNNNITINVNSQTGDPAEIRRSTAAAAKTLISTLNGARRYG